MLKKKLIAPLAAAVLAFGFTLTVAPAPAEAATAPCRQYQYSQGGTGSCVKAIQSLTAVAAPRIAHDGIFGAATRNAVKTFQGRYGLDADGIVGPKTWAKLCSPGNVGILSTDVADYNWAKRYAC